MENKRFLEFKKAPIIFGILFGLVLYIFLRVYFNPEANISSINQKEFFLNYIMYSPILFSLLSIIFLYFLFFIKFIFKLKSIIFTILIYLISFGFFLFLGIDLMYFESRLADFMLVIINTFSIPLIISSSFIMILIILLSFLKPKTIK